MSKVIDLSNFSCQFYAYLIYEKTLDFFILITLNNVYQLSQSESYF